MSLSACMPACFPDPGRLYNPGFGPVESIEMFELIESCREGR